MELKPFKHVTIGDIMEVQGIFKKSIKEAVPLIRKIEDRLNLIDDQWRHLCRIAQKLQD